MLHQWIRLIGKKGAVFTDLSIKNSDDAQTWVWDFDAVYVGKQFPFNNFHIWVDTANATLEDMKISIWDGNDFEPAVDVLDVTSSLSRSGIVQFTPNEHDSWNREDSEDIPEMADGPKIYDLYWAKLEFANPIDITTQLKQLSYAFTDDRFLSTIDSDIDRYLSPLGQTDWIPQILMASMQTAIDLKSRGLIIDEGQIIQFDDFYVSCAYRTLAVIYFSLGPDFEDKRQMAMREYNMNLKTRRLTIDKDMDGKIDQSDMRNTIRTLTR
jgi:hypothetical protein